MNEYEQVNYQSEKNNEIVLIIKLEGLYVYKPEWFIKY